MSTVRSLAQNRTRDMIASVFIYAIPVLAVFLYFVIKGETPWLHNTHQSVGVNLPPFFHFVSPIFTHLQSWGFLVVALVLGVIEFSLGLYDNKWTKSERTIDIVC